MIPRPSIVEWGRTVPWPTVDQIEQDLLLSRLIVAIANDQHLGEELVFRGGTCLRGDAETTGARRFQVRLFGVTGRRSRLGRAWRCRGTLDRVFVPRFSSGRQRRLTR